MATPPVGPIAPANNNSGGSGSGTPGRQQPRPQSHRVAALPAKAHDGLTEMVEPLLDALAKGDLPAAISGLAQVEKDLDASPETAAPLQALIEKLSPSLASGSTATALDDLSGYLIRNGHASGSLLDTDV